MKAQGLTQEERDKRAARELEQDGAALRERYARAQARKGQRRMDGAGMIGHGEGWIVLGRDGQAYFVRFKGGAWQVLLVWLTFKALATVDIERGRA